MACRSLLLIAVRSKAMNYGHHRGKGLNNKGMPAGKQDLSFRTIKNII
jgi:hypothetical protein